MQKAYCPNCGAEYEVGGIATICGQCRQALPTPEAESAGPPLITAPPPAPTAVTPSPASQRRPCSQCGEPLYATEMTCWKCGASQIGAAVPAPVGVPPPPTAGVPPPGPYAPPQPASPYSGGQFMYGPNPEVVKRGNLSLILGIIGLATLPCCGALPGIILGPIAIWLGHSARREGAEGTATGGFICGIVATVLGLLALAFIIALFATGAFNSVGAPTSGPTP